MNITQVVKEYNDGINGMSTGMSFNIKFLKLLKYYDMDISLVTKTVKELNDMSHYELMLLFDSLKEN